MNEGRGSRYKGLGFGGMAIISIVPPVRGCEWGDVWVYLIVLGGDQDSYLWGFLPVQPVGFLPGTM